MVQTGARHFASIAVEHGRFVVRCATAATAAYFLASSVDLPHPVWAPISALIVSQESLNATRTSVLGRFIGTLVGVLVALLVNRLGALIGLSLTPQMAIAVALCALCAKERPAIRVCLWTAPLVLATTTPSAPAEVTAFFRGCEVLTGATVGGLIHFAEERLLAPIVRRKVEDRRAGSVEGNIGRRGEAILCASNGDGRSRPAPAAKPRCHRPRLAGCIGAPHG